MRAASIYIATPTANGVMASDHVASLAAMLTRLHAAGLGTRYRTVDGPDLATERDMLAADFLRSDCTHLLMVGGDVAFGPGLCETLIRSGKSVIGAAMTRRSLDLRRLETLLENRRFEAALALARDWKVKLAGGSITVEGGIGKVEALSADFLLIGRSAVEAVAEAPETERYVAPDGRALLPALFRDLRNGSAVLSHDFAFCDRWRRTGGEVWVFPAADARRVLGTRFGVPFGRYLSALTRDGPGGLAARDRAGSGGA